MNVMLLGQVLGDARHARAHNDQARLRELCEDVSRERLFKAVGFDQHERVLIGRGGHRKELYTRNFPRLSIEAARRQNLIE
jgi:hypothetical protein